MTNCTQTMVEHELARQAHFAGARDANTADVQRIADVVAAVGSRWQDTVETMAAAHPGTVLALFHRLGTNIERTIGDTLIDTCPSAVIETEESRWVAALVPAALRLHLGERHHGLTGLVLLEEATWGVTTEVCIRFLRNLVGSVANNRLAELVVAGRGTGFAGRRRTAADARDRLAKLGGFGSGVLDSGITVADCLPHVRSALRA